MPVAGEDKNTVGAHSWRRDPSRFRNESQNQALNLEGAEGGSPLPPPEKT